MLKALARRLLPTRIYGPVRAWRVRRFVSRYDARTVQHMYAGYPLSVYLDDPLAEGWYDTDWDEPAEIARLRGGRLAPGATVFDIGAHQGVVALILARIVGEEGRVVAVEAEPHNAAVAKRNVSANGAHNMTVVHAAAGATAGMLSFTESLNGNVATPGRPGAIEVRSTTVDAMAQVHGEPDVVLIDVEGFEAHVVAGAAETIATGKTDFFVELHDATALAAAGSTAIDVLQAFEDRDFDVQVAIADESSPGVGMSHLVSQWKTPADGLHTLGRRCFVVAFAKQRAVGSAT